MQIIGQEYVSEVERRVSLKPKRCLDCSVG